MNEMPPAESAADFPGKTWALRLGAMLVAAFVLIVLLAFIDRAGRPELEAAKGRDPVAEQR